MIQSLILVCWLSVAPSKYHLPGEAYAFPLSEMASNEVSATLATQDGDVYVEKLVKLCEEAMWGGAEIGYAQAAEYLDVKNMTQSQLSDFSDTQ